MGEYPDLFEVLDRKLKLYRRRDDGHAAWRLPMERFVPHLNARDPAPPREAGTTAFSIKLPLRELTEQTLLQKVIPCAALVNARGDILYLHGRTGLYLEPTPGEPGVSNLLKMARDGLRPDLTTALRQASANRENVRRAGVRVKTNGDFTRVNLLVCPVTPDPATKSETPLFLVVLEPAQLCEGEPARPAHAAADGADASGTDTDARIAALKEELRSKEDYLQTSNEEMETINEELATVNAELQTKVSDLSRTNNDMNNLLAGTGIGTVFVDHQLRILRFTPDATKIINLILSDIGRPVGHLLPNLVGYDRLVADTQSVLDTLIPKELAVQTTAGVWYRMRIHPYRNRDNVIEGAVLTFVDLTEIMQSREALRRSEDLLRLAVVVRDAHDAITVQDLDGRILAWNRGAERLFGWSEAEALRMNVRDRIPEGLREDALTTVHRLSQAEVLEPFLTQGTRKEGTLLDVWLTASALMNEAGTMYAIATTERAKRSGSDDRPRT